MADYQIELTKLEEELSLTALYVPEDIAERVVTSREVNRPGLELTGYMEHFESNRINVFGNQEVAYLNSITEEERIKAVTAILSQEIPAVFFSRGITPGESFMDIARKYEVPVYQSEDGTSSLIAALVSYLNVQLAPRVTRHGVLVEVYGIGVLIVGESGVGKSETLIELIKRGHRMVADDAVEILRVSAKSLVGRSPSNIRHFSEIRGIGIINVANLFGMGAVKPTERIMFVVNLEQWDDNKVYDRMGLSRDYTEILGLKIPVMTIPVRQGRNLAVIIEVATMNFRQKESGHDAAAELLKSLGMNPEDMVQPEKKIELDI